ncbi:hypothetical protein KMW28_13535 [Flammeovirga yaeyamensis]|uniref:Uncharacterized protein n=1 Tax=Flammeovirga yaeyamensis TaxID=367791 RepID=A0AAX1MZB1_9BACT|nr:hypothetical protein [Flammeovirga yaeyamensis]MBB3700915.1 hypothetical protein [Flammeovirga yaeyamensis]NMF38023.1 hypothetical protein [Flammeovirga yaeyamensis]QWG00673.1 hypothetical protein KMW28_13535 [Flammeovirga yaeyamensis]
MDIDAVIVSHANYSPEYLLQQEDKIESIVEFFVVIIFEDNFDDFEDNPFSHNESKSFSPIVCFYPSIPKIVDEAKPIKTKTSQQHFYLDRNYPTPIQGIVPPPPRAC